MFGVVVLFWVWGGGLLLLLCGLVVLEVFICRFLFHDIGRGFEG